MKIKLTNKKRNKSFVLRSLVISLLYYCKDIKLILKVKLIKLIIKLNLMGSCVRYAHA